MPIKKEIVFHLFLECCHYIDDIFWKNIFEDLAYGKTPFGTYISKDFLCCSYSKKEFSYKIEKKDPEIIFKEVYSLLTKRLGLLSQKETIIKKKVFTDLGKSINNSRKSWSDIKKKNLRELLIELYVSRMKTKHNLSIKQVRYLLSSILTAITFKVINVNDINYNNGRINSITGIDFIKNKIVITHNLDEITTSFSHSEISDKKIMSDNWLKYIVDLRKITEN